MFSGTPAEDKTPAADMVSAIPFSVKSPERFSADVSVKSFAAGEAIERKYFVAANKEKTLERFGIGTADEFAIVKTGIDTVYRLNPEKKEYVRLDLRKVSPGEDSLMRSLTSRWLNENRRSVFTDLGLENGLHKYQVEIEGSKNTLVLIYIDEKLNFPVRQEFYTVAGEKKELSFLLELTNITTEPEESLFELPEGYREAG